MLTESLLKMDQKILIIESDSAAAQKLQGFLSAQDGAPFQIRAAETGQRGLSIHREWQSDCILLDLNLPDMNGVDFLAQLNDTEGLPPCAVIATGKLGQEIKGSGIIRHGAVDFVLLEQATAQGLAQVVEHAIEKFATLRALEQKNAALQQARNHLERLVTERTADLAKTHEELKAGHQRYIALVGNVPGAIYSCSGLPDREMHLLSPFIEQITGYPSEAFVGNAAESFENVIHPDDRTEAREKILQQLQNQGHFALEYRILHQNGTVLWVLDKGRQILDEQGNMISVEGIIFDITERRQVEEERLRASKLESIGLLAGGVAHDLNNILTAISANVQLGLLEQERGQSVEARLQNANNACSSAADLAKQLLTFAKGGAPVRKPTDVAKLVAQTVKFSLHGSKTVPEFEVAEDLSLTEIDENQIGQVINNLVINADQAMPQGGRLRVILTNEEQDGKKPGLPRGSYVKISVEDEGDGIPKEKLGKIFDPYFTTKEKGTGLGLATSYSIIKRHRGVITVDSEAGRGTRFHIYLPALPPGAEEIPQTAEEHQPHGGHRVLFMDDNELIRSAVSNLLNTMGYEVSLACKGEDAVSLYREAISQGRPYDFVLLDLTIPGGLGGKETLTKLQEINPDVIAIVVSGYSDDALMASCREHGFRASLTKPFTLQTVKEVLTQIEADLEKVPVAS